MEETKMKKLLSLTLAVIMLLSVMPFSYMASAKLSTEGQKCVEAYLRLICYVESVVYEDGNAPDFIEDIVYDTMEEVNALNLGCGIYYEDLNDSKNAAAVAVMTEKFLSGAKEIEKLLAEQNIIITVDTYEFYKYFVLAELIYSEEEINSVSKIVENKKYAEMYQKAEEILMESEQYLKAGRSGEKTVTQAEFDAIWKQACPIYDMIYNCLDGNHLYSEYVSNNDATTESDGTKTAECEFCGATDTVVDEGSQLSKEEDTVSFFEVIIALVIGFFEILFSIMA